MKTFLFSVPGFGLCSALGATRSQARYRLWLQYSDAYSIGFGDFLRMIDKSGRA